MRVLIFAPYFPPAYRGGGPVRSVYNLAMAAEPDIDIWVITRDSDLGAPMPSAVSSDAWSDVGNRCRVWYARTQRRRSVWRALVEGRKVRPQAVYVSGFFDPLFGLVPQLLWLLGWWGLRSRPVRMVAVRGQLRAPALALKAAKKRRTLQWYRRFGLHRSVVWHCTSEAEADDVRTIMGSRADLVVRPNDTLFSPASEVTGVSTPPRLVFFGRLSPIKGLDLLLEALRNVGAPLTLDVYGPEEDPEYTERCRALSRAMPSEVQVRFLGALPHERVASTVRDYDLMVAPTASENFGQSIAEGLSVGVPVMVSDVTPWTPVIEAGAGILVPERSTDAWTASLNDYLGRSSAARADLKEGALAGFRDWFGRRPTSGVLSALQARVEARRLA